MEMEMEELEKLEEDVKNMAQKIAEFKETLPDHLNNTLASIIAAQRPPIFTDGRTPIDSEDSANISVENDPIHTQKVEIIKQKISDNASMMPLLVKRMTDCMPRFDNLQPFKQDVIHPAFTRKRTT